MITRLVLENWRSHANTEFEFSKGTNVLVGAMGSGKSSAIDAICFALFGSFPNLQQRKIKLDDVIKNRPKEEQDASVTLDFSVGGKSYSVHRKLQRGKGTSKSELREAGHLIEGPNSQRVTERVCEILKMDYELFSRAVYSEQNGIDYFLEMPKGQRKAKIDELLRISRFENARKNLGTVVTRLRDRKAEKDGFASSQREISNIPALEDDIRKKTAQLDESARALKEARMELMRITASHEKVMKNKREFEDVDREIKNNAGRLDLLSEKLRGTTVRESIGELEKIAEKLKEERKAAKQCDEERRRIEKEVGRVGGLVQAARESVSGYEKELKKAKPGEKLEYEKEAAKKSLDKIASEIEEAVSGIKSREAKLDELHENIGKLKGDKCPVCSADLSDAKRREITEHRRSEITHIEKEAAELRAQERGLRASKKEAEDRLDGACKELERAEKMRWVASEKQRLEGEVTALSAKQEELAHELRKAASARPLDDIDAELEGTAKKLEHKRMEKERADTADAQEKLAKKLAAIDYDEKAEKKLYDGMKSADKEASNLEKDCAYTAESIKDAKARLADLNKVKDEVAKCAAESQYLADAVDSFQTLQKVLQDVQTSLRENFTEATNVALSEIWGRVYPYGDYADLRLGIDSAGDYVLQLKRRSGEWVSVEGVTSGGERSTACLALRIALSLVLTKNLSWLVLDEPTHNLDAEGIRTLAAVLKDHLPVLVEQIFLVTHEEELESAASGSLYRLERDKAGEGATTLLLEKSR